MGTHSLSHVPRYSCPAHSWCPPCRPSFCSSDTGYFYLWCLCTFYVYCLVDSSIRSCSRWLFFFFFSIQVSAKKVLYSEATLLTGCPMAMFYFTLPRPGFHCIISNFQLRLFYSLIYCLPPTGRCSPGKEGPRLQC